MVQNLIKIFLKKVKRVNHLGQELRRVFIKSVAIIFVVSIGTNFIDTVECAAVSEQARPYQCFEELLNNLTPNQVEDLNREFNVDNTNMRGRIALAIIINVTILGAVIYGPTIVKGIYNTVTNLPSDLYSIYTHLGSFFIETAHQAALRNYNNADPQRAAQMLQRVIEMINPAAPSA